MARWIKTETRLPEEGVDVLICVQYEGWEPDEWSIELASLDTDRPNPPIPDYNLGIWSLGSAQNYTVSHWMPLPDYPQD